MPDGDGGNGLLAAPPPDHQWQVNGDDWRVTISMARPRQQVGQACMAGVVRA